MTEPHSSSEEFLLIRDNTNEKVLGDGEGAVG